MNLPTDFVSGEMDGHQLAREMGDHPVLRSLCRTCLDCETCMYCKQASKPIVHCEEFKPCDSVRCHAGPKRRDLPSKEQAMAMMCESSDLKGLCMNCENRFNCSFPKPQGGVWHCAEFQ